MASVSGLETADARDRALAENVLERLERDGRDGHPATAHLDLVRARGKSLSDHVHIAAVAFETGCRVRLGQIAGPAAMQGLRPDILAPFLVDRPPTRWECGSRLPYTEVNWRAVIAAGAEDLRQDAFEMPMAIPGAHVFTELAPCLGDRAAFVAAIIGPAERDETFDPVATSGSFLAQAIDGYLDLDLIFRQHRENAISAVTSTAGPAA